jgi:hypothetical protein
MLVYGDRWRLLAPAALLDDIEAAIAAADETSGLERLDRLTQALILAGELAQGSADAEAEASGKDDCSIAGERTMALATALASDLLAAAGQPARGSDPQSALASVRELELPPRLRCKTSEGYAFYAIYPEDYAAAAAASVGREGALVIGLRSIGTSLAATVAARLGCPVVTVRPRGHPFSRHLCISDALRERLIGHQGLFLIADEGPGLSGSSFGATGDLLEVLGIPLDRVLFLASHANGLGPRASAGHRLRWERSRRTNAAREISPEAVAGWFQDVIGPAARVEDLSGGAWRSGLSDAGRPPAAPVAERRKFRLTSARGRFVARFAGLGETGEEKLETARILYREGLVPEPLALRRGFLLERWCEGRPLGPAEARSPGFLRHLGSYLGTRARSLPAGSADGASVAELCHMATVNAAEMGGAELARLVEARLADAERLAGLVPVRIDGRLHTWEWLRLPNGRFIKTDALDHAAAHDLVGCQDIAWDVAGAAVELGLSNADTEGLRRAVGAVAGRDVRPEAVAAFRICYAAFQGGLWSMTGEGGTVGAARVEALGREYLAALRGAVEAEAVPVFARAEPPAQPPIAVAQ